MLPRTRQLLTLVSKVVEKLPNKIALAGHTDATPYRPGAVYTNWELSADRANASRRVMEEAGVQPQRIARVAGKAATEPLVPKDPADPKNRRITILLLREAPASSDKQ